METMILAGHGKQIISLSLIIVKPKNNSGMRRSSLLVATWAITNLLGSCSLTCRHVPI